MSRKFWSVEALTLLYFLSYLPYIMITRYVATEDQPSILRALTGLEIIPAMLIVAAILTFVFSWLAGWFKDVRRIRIGSLAIPFATRNTFILGVCTAVIITVVPLSYTLVGVSIPLIQLLMRGDILIIAPLVDAISGRKVRWWSWVALGLVGIGMISAFLGRGDLNLPVEAIAVIIVYTIAYFGRLMVMSRISKDGDTDKMKVVFLEEKIIGFPVALITLAAIGLLAGNMAQGQELRLGFLDIWTMPAVGWIAICGAMVFLTGIFATFILLDARENSFCVPLERSASILAGVLGSVALTALFDFPLPSAGEFVGAGLLVVAILVLTFGPRLGRVREPAPLAAQAERGPAADYR